MKIHKLILPTSVNKLLARILWTRRNKHSNKYKTSWIEGVEEFDVNEVLIHEANIFLTLKTNQIQSKHSLITIQLKNNINDKKAVKYCSFKIDLSDYIDTYLLHKIFTKHIKYKNNSGTKKVDIIFSIKSTQLHHNNIESEDDGISICQSDAVAGDDKISINTLQTIKTINNNHDNDGGTSLKLNELKKKYLKHQQKLLVINTSNNIHNNIHNNINTNGIGYNPNPNSGPNPNSNRNPNPNLNDNKLLEQISSLKNIISSQKKRISSLDKYNRTLISTNNRLLLKISSLETRVEHSSNIINNNFSIFKYLSFTECDKLEIGSYIDHRDETGHFLLAQILKKKKKKRKIYIHYEGWASKWDLWINYSRESKLNKISYPKSISRKSNTRFLNIKIYDKIDINPEQRHQGWRYGIIKKLDKFSGQVQVEYNYNNEKYFYWAHLNDVNEIAPYMTKSCQNIKSDYDQSQREEESFTNTDNDQ